MIRSITTNCLLLLGFATLTAQTTSTFEDFNLPVDTFLNGSEGSGGFALDNAFLPNSYDQEYDSWGGWSISTTTDTQTPGFMNQYSAIPGSGYDGSDAYAVSYHFSHNTLELTGPAAGCVVEGCYITNGTYPYLSMLNGDGFAKKFGGETGDDPDFYLLTIKKYLNGELSTDSVDFYLADYRFEDNNQDYIVDEWTYLDLSVLGNADSLAFFLSSSDTNQFGINTPSYFCIDNLTTSDMVTSTTEVQPLISLMVFPNPAKDRLTIDWEDSQPAQFALLDSNGRRLRQFWVTSGQTQLNVQGLARGSYFLQRIDQLGWQAVRVVKN